MGRPGRVSRSRPRWAAVVLVGAVVWLASGPVLADGAFRGVVFLDADGDGRRDPGERGVEGVAVHHGVRVVETDADGRYSIPRPSDDGWTFGREFVFITRPDGTSSRRWYRPATEAVGDFPLEPSPLADENGFFFIHFTDAHTYDLASDFLEFSAGPRTWWMPEIARNYFILYLARRLAEPHYTEDVAAGLRAELVPVLGEEKVAGMGDGAVVGALLEEFGREGSEIGDVEGQIRASFEEIARLAPDFAISTGDQVLEGNEALPEPIERWMHFYRAQAEALPFPVFETIGNNEIAGNKNPDFALDDPRFGKGLYRQVFGPSHYSFDIGRFHFVALDTHSQGRPAEDPRNFSFEKPENGFWSWARADLEAHPDRIPVLLNHEPFLHDPHWHMDADDFREVDDKGMIERFDVPLVLSGHIHRNGLVERGGATHVTTGALSGFRWALPVDVYHRGYRLFLARGERFYSAWKRTGHGVVSLIEPRGASVHHPASGGRSAPEEEGVRVVAVAADANGPFPGVRMLLDGRPLPMERWGRYFVSALVPPERLGGPGELVVEALRLDGSVLEDRAKLGAAASQVAR